MAPKNKPVAGETQHVGVCFSSKQSAFVVILREQKVLWTEEIGSIVIQENSTGMHLAAFTNESLGMTFFFSFTPSNCMFLREQLSHIH